MKKHDQSLALWPVHVVLSINAHFAFCELQFPHLKMGNIDLTKLQIMHTTEVNTN